MEILSSLYTATCTAWRPGKNFDVKARRCSTKRSLEKPVLVQTEDGPACDSNNNCFEESKGVEEVVSGTTWNVEAPSQPQEARTTLTPQELKNVLKSCDTGTKISATEDLLVRGDQLAGIEVFDRKLFKKLKAGGSPSLKSISLHKLNLSAGREKSHLRMRDFPNGLESLSLRDSTFEPRSFFEWMDGDLMKNLRVLDLSRTTFAKGRYVTPLTVWPRMRSLRELYLEGALQGQSKSALANILKSFPNLEVLDLECVNLGLDDLATIARLLPNLRELYLGQTNIKNASVMQLVHKGRSLDNLEALCLCGTDMTDTGLQHLVYLCPRLRMVIARGSSVSTRKAKVLEELFPGLRIDLDDMMSVFVIHQDRCCDHYSLKQDEKASEDIEVMKL